ncbi:hypothetical protein KGM_206686A, partial [Danaus plexippus plexippus]
MSNDLDSRGVSGCR